MAMTSTRPYLLRAMYEWMLDNDLTPQLVVDAEADDVHVPRQYVSDGRIVLNVSPAAVREVRSELFPENPPTSTLLVVAGLASPDYLMEIEAVAEVD